MPMTIEMNITEDTVRWPTVSVISARDHARLTARTASMTSGWPRRRKARSSRPSVSAKASPAASLLSSKAVLISSFDSAGPPVTPAWTPGNSAWSLAMRRRISSMAARRSEEHTSELQSRSDLVCRLLLEKKKEDQRCTRPSHRQEPDHDLQTRTPVLPASPERHVRDQPVPHARRLYHPARSYHPDALRDT